MEELLHEKDKDIVNRAWFFLITPDDVRVVRLCMTYFTFTDLDFLDLIKIHVLFFSPKNYWLYYVKVGQYKEQ